MSFPIEVPRHIAELPISGDTPEQNRANTLIRIQAMRELLVPTLRQMSRLPVFEDRGWKLRDVTLQIDSTERVVQAWAFGFSTFPPNPKKEPEPKKPKKQRQRQWQEREYRTVEQALGFTVQTDDPFGTVILTQEYGKNIWRVVDVEILANPLLAGLLSVLNQLAKGENSPPWGVPYLPPRPRP